MKANRRILTVVATVLLGTMMALAQEKSEVWSWTFIEAVKGKDAELEKAIKDKTIICRSFSNDQIMQ